MSRKTRFNHKWKFVNHAVWVCSKCETYVKNSGFRPKVRQDYVAVKTVDVDSNDFYFNNYERKLDVCEIEIVQKVLMT